MEIVHKDRNANYGSPEDNFKQIAELWSAYKKLPFTSADVAVMNMLIKVARLSTNPQHHDSTVDIAGYAACLGDIQAKARSASYTVVMPDGNKLSGLRFKQEVACGTDPVVAQVGPNEFKVRG